ncbi:MAG: GTPase HflX [Ruminococcaceae bacterium]|nr:GTPase HflX [Oscillospiraceae bacterium]
MKFYENTSEKEKVMLISVDTGEFSAEESMEELSELVRTAGGETELTMIQKLPEVNPATFVGSGRIAEVKEACENHEIDLIVADDELSPAQLKNIEDITGVRVIDRTMLILDIFALHARTGEGKLQVELAQLKYSLPFLTGKGKGLSRLGGGIGTRGPGESKLESDKRHIRRRIYALEDELKRLEKRRNNMRKRRKKDGIISVAIVGYTNAGKSTLMNRLTNAGVLAEDKLFATLDPTARKLTLPDGQSVMLVDTVGLVRRLPHKLVEAFKSTLEEAKNADLILNVCDASSEECSEHLRITSELLRELECEDIPVISVMNKCDLVPDIYSLPTIGKSVMISALEGRGIDTLLNEIQNTLPRTRTRVKLLIPFDKGGILADIRNDGVIHSEEYTPDGTLADATVNLNYLEKIKQYIKE